MLPQHLRLRTSADFVSVMRQGLKVRRPTLVLYAQRATDPRFGLVVGKKVGNAVTRNRVKRMLRHRAADLIGVTQPLSVVVRALPGAAVSDQALAADLASAWRQAAKAAAV